jgi:RecA-family ATPase
VVTLANVHPESVSWVWPARVPVGKLTVLDGDPGVTKSTLAVEMAAHVSTGRPWPDRQPCPQGDVLVLSAEDGLADTIRPRLDAAGGDPSRVHALTGVRYLDDDGELRERPVTLADIGPIGDAIRAHGVTLLIIDVLMAYLPGGTDSHRDQDVRSVLARLAALAEDTGCAVLLLRHLNKTAGGNPLYRGGGSIGIVGAARSGLLVAVDPEDDARRVLTTTKCNLAPEPQSLAYRVAEADNGVACIVWDGTSTHRASDLLDRREDDDERSERHEAVEWLLDYLARNGGEVRAGDATRDAARDGIAKTTLHRARRRAGVGSVKSGLHGGWVWRLDQPRFHQGSEGSSPQDRESSEPSPSTVAPILAMVNGSTVPCRVCGEPMRPSEPGQTTHPDCDFVEPR